MWFIKASRLGDFLCDGIWHYNYVSYQRGQVKPYNLHTIHKLIRPLM